MQEALEQTSDIGVIQALGLLPADAIISEEGLAKMLGKCRTSIKRAVRRGELPPPTKWFGQQVWTVQVLRDHTNMRLEAARKDAERLRQRLSRLDT